MAAHVLILAMLFLPLFCRGAETGDRKLSREQLNQMLGADDLDTRLRAISVIQNRSIQDLDETLRKIAFDPRQPNKLRIASIAALAPRLFPVDAHLFEFVRSNLTIENPPLMRLGAARTLAGFRLSDMQMLSAAKNVGEADALVLPTLLRAFLRTSNDAAGLSLVIALAKAPAASLSADLVAHVLSHFSVGVRTAARQMLQPIGVDLEQRQKHLEEFMPLLANGDPGRGKAVFFGNKAACSTCHAIGGQGGLLGPDLTRIGTVRSGSELLEAIVYPVAGGLPGFEYFKVGTTDRQNYSGTIIRQASDAIWIRGTDLGENKIETKRIKTIVESSTSVMPTDLLASLGKDELRDLLAYLQSLK